VRKVYELYDPEGAKPSVTECFWFCKTGSLDLHKVLIRGPCVILSTISLIGQLSAELLERLPKEFPKTPQLKIVSRGSPQRPVMPLVSSVPIIASLRRLSQGCKASFYKVYLNNYLLRTVIRPCMMHVRKHPAREWMQNQTVNRCESTLECINCYNGAFSNLGSFFINNTA
jgi:hypothetical protein